MLTGLLLTPWYDGWAEIIPFRCLPVLLGGKGTSHVGWDTGDLPSQGKKLRASNPTRSLIGGESLFKVRAMNEVDAGRGRATRQQEGDFPEKWSV
jgi:hypothetical protein